MLVQTENRQFVRDVRNHALLTTDTHALTRARAQRALAVRNQSLQDELAHLREQVESLMTVVATLQSPSK